jgi:hypothetical protein
MTPDEIFSNMTPALGARIFTDLAAKEANLYRATIDTFAKQRKLRPVFIERKTEAERHEWLRTTTGKKVNHGVAAHLLQIWLVGQHAKLLCDFLDALGISHDANGTIDELPPAPEKAALAAAIDSILQKHEQDVVKVYLHAFQALDGDGGWPSLEELLAENLRLKL